MKMSEYGQYLEESVCTNRKTRLLEVLAAFLLGMILGFLITPPRYFKAGCDNKYGCDCDEPSCKNKEKETEE